MKLILFTWLAVFFLCIPADSFGQLGTTLAALPSTMVNEATAQQNKALIRNLYEQVLNKRNLGLLPEYFSPTYAGPGALKGPAGFEKPLSELIRAFPDIHWTLEKLIAEGNEVVVKWHWEGTHTAPFQYIPASGKKITNTGMAVYELENGKIVKAQPQTDRLGFLQQLDWLPDDLSDLAKNQPDPARVFFIDRFRVPQQALAEFRQRMEYNLTFIKQLPGFVGDEVYEHIDDAGKSVVITIAVWANQAHLDAAKNAVQAEYQRIGFDPQAFSKTLGIELERGIYKKAAE